MSRYIDKDFMENHYESILLVPTPDVTQSDKRNAKIVLDALSMERSIDIVRCGECKYFEPKEDWCYWRDEMITADGFCSYGQKERASDGETANSICDMRIPYSDDSDV